jgi:hypothetical protein
MVGGPADEALAWGPWLAALLGAVENVALLRMLRGAVEKLWPQIARRCAVSKFALVITGLLHSALSAFIYFAEKSE